ncbi:MAG: glycosyltransferase family 4 protein [Thiotrichaceae bacterium]|nr:glycosyltransferase family 4 protein [Thiotrichaceae bacterium]
MSPLEKMFFQVCREIFNGQDNVHFAFKNFDKGRPESLPNDFSNLITIDMASTCNRMLSTASKYILENNITSALCFDLQVRSPICNMLRNSGVKKIASYWGAPISGNNNIIMLTLKRIEVALSSNKPDLFIFESEAMRRFAVHGRGILFKNTRVIPTGIDTNKFQPNTSSKKYVSEEFGIPLNNKIIFYSGHMEERKGVKTIIEAAIKLIDEEKLTHWYFLICGNRPNEEKPFLKILENTKAKEHVIFAGYRTDINNLIPGCDIGVIPSTGWDSFPMSCLEIASCGLPLVVSELQGLTETIEENVTGLSFTPGDSTQLASAIIKLDQNEQMRLQFSQAARERIIKGYSLEQQYKSLFFTMKKTFA